MSKASYISGDSGERLSKERDRYMNPTDPLVSLVHILQTDNDSWSKALRVTLALDRKRAHEKAPVIVLNKPEPDLDTRKLENQRTREPGKAGQPEKPVAPGGLRYMASRPQEAWESIRNESVLNNAPGGDVGLRKTLCWQESSM